MPLGTFSKLPRESLRALYYKLGGTDDISDLRTRRALLKKIYEAMGNDSADLDNMHRANSVLQKISEVASGGGSSSSLYVGVNIDAMSDVTPGSGQGDPGTEQNPLILSSDKTAEINAVFGADKIPIFELVEGSNASRGVQARLVSGSTGWRISVIFSGPSVSPSLSYFQSSDYTADGVTA